MLTVGGAAKSDENVDGNGKTEIYDWSTKKWSSKKDYPYRQTLIDYQLLSTKDGFIVFGGYAETISMSLSIIAKFDPKKNSWTKLTNLQFSRHGFGAIEIEKKFVILGGKGKIRSELCQYGVNGLACKSREPTLTSFQEYPVMMKIDPDFTNKCKMYSTVTKPPKPTTKTSSKANVTTPKSSSKTSKFHFILSDVIRIFTNLNTIRYSVMTHRKFYFLLVRHSVYLSIT